MGQAGGDELLHVPEDVGKRLRPGRRRSGQRRLDLARPRPREDRVPLGLAEVAGDPVQEAAALLPEDVFGQVAEQGRATPLR